MSQGSRTTRPSLRLGAIALLAGAAALGSGCGGGGSSTTRAIPPAAGLNNFADLVDRVQSGVVQIDVKSCDGQSIGTGFLLKPRLVATVEHVVAGASSIALKRAGRVIGTAHVIGVDRDRDLALLQTNKPIRGYTFGFAGHAPRLGEEVAALGFPLGLPLTVTKGSVSGLNRVVPIDGLKRRRLVQTDAAINHGNSGGPLLSTDTGKVVGLIDLGTTEANGIAFAVSAAVAAPLLRAWAASPQAPASSPCSPGAGAPVGSAAGVNQPVGAYVDAVDAALIDSARTRGDLGDLINAVNDGSIDPTSAIEEINAIIDQRRELLAAVTEVESPAAFAHSAAQLRASLVAALGDDLAIENWIKASFRQDASAANRYWQQQLRLSQQATAAKKQFLDNYNALRSRLLHLPPLDVAY